MKETDQPFMKCINVEELQTAVMRERRFGSYSET